MDQLCAVAEVSKRTLYQHFAGKDETGRRAPRRFDPDLLPEVFDSADSPPRERLLAVFEIHARARSSGQAVEIRDPGHAACARPRLQAGLRGAAHRSGPPGRRHRPEQLGEQLALLLDGASARSGSSTPTACHRRRHRRGPRRQRPRLTSTAASRPKWRPAQVRRARSASTTMPSASATTTASASISAARSRSPRARARASSSSAYTTWVRACQGLAPMARCIRWASS